MTDITIVSHEVLSESEHPISPTAAGMNIICIRLTRNVAQSFTAPSGTIFKQSRTSISASPHMLAGMGRGMMRLSISPKKETVMIIANCFMYFIFYLFDFYRIIIYHNPPCFKY